MNKQHTFEDDILAKYINPEAIEKAPEGFTSKTMTRIQIESESSKVHRRIFFKNPVPFVSVLVTLILIAAVLFIPSGSSDSIGQSVLDYINNIGISLPRIDLWLFPELNLPGWFAYAFISILLFAFFDKALLGIFNREKK